MDLCSTRALNGQYVKEVVEEPTHHLAAIGTEQESSHFVRPEDFGPRTHQEVEPEQQDDQEDHFDPANEADVARLLTSSDASKFKKLFEFASMKKKIF